MMKEAKHQHLNEELTVSLQPILVQLLNRYDLGMYIIYIRNMLLLYVYRILRSQLNET